MLPSRRGTKLPEYVPHQQVVHHLEDIFLSLPDETIQSWLDPVLTPLKRATLLRAGKYVCEKHVRAWVQTCNNEHGTVVMSDVIVHQFNDLMQKMLPTIDRPVLDACTQTARKWVSRWRRRHGAKVLALETADPLPVQQQHEKVHPFVFILSQTKRNSKQMNISITKT